LCILSDTCDIGEFGSGAWVYEEIFHLGRQERSFSNLCWEVNLSSHLGSEPATWPGIKALRSNPKRSILCWALPLFSTYAISSTINTPPWMPMGLISAVNSILGYLSCASTNLHNIQIAPTRNDKVVKIDWKTDTGITQALSPRAGSLFGAPRLQVEASQTRAARVEVVWGPLKPEPERLVAGPLLSKGRCPLQKHSQKKQFKHRN